MNPLTIYLDPAGKWMTEWYVLLLLCSLFLIFKHYKKIGIFPCLFWFWVVGEALYVIEFPGNPFGSLNSAFKYTAGQAALELILVPMAVLALPLAAWKIIPWITGIECVLLWNGQGSSLMGWESFGCALIAATIPFIPHWLKAVVIVTIITRHAQTAWLIVLAQFVALAIHHKSLRKYFLLLVPAVALLVYKHRVNPSFDYGERLGEWKQTFAWWKAQSWKSIIAGVSPGSYVWVSMLIKKFQPPLFLQAHNDFWQVLFETGAVGFALGIGAVATAIARTWKDPVLLAGVLGLMAFAAPYHPTRWAVSAFVGAMIMRAALVKQK